MRTELHTANGKEYKLIIEENSLGGRVTPTFQGNPLGATYSVSIEVAHDFNSHPGANALQEILKIVKDDLDRGIFQDREELQ